MGGFSAGFLVLAVRSIGVQDTVYRHREDWLRIAPHPGDKGAKVTTLAIDQQVAKGSEILHASPVPIVEGVRLGRGIRPDDIHRQVAPLGRRRLGRYSRAGYSRAVLRRPRRASECPCCPSDRRPVPAVRRDRRERARWRTPVRDRSCVSYGCDPSAHRRCTIPRFLPRERQRDQPSCRPTGTRWRSSHSAERP